MTTDYPPHALPASLEDATSVCRFCGGAIIWGLTQNGKRAPFDDVGPYPNHWITCSKVGEARKAFPR